MGPLIEASPDQAQLYALRAREAERAAEFEAAERDWKEFASRVADPAEGQLALADFYQRRLRPVDEVEALLAVGRSPSPAPERFTEPELQRSWRAFERIVEVSQRHLLPDRITLDAYRSWLARYSDQQGVYRRYLDFLTEHEMFAAGESLLADYAAAFPTDSIFPMGARAQLARASNGPDAALLLFEASFEPLWPLELFETYFRSLEDADRLRERLDQAQQRVASAPDDLASVSWVFHYRRRQGDREGAIVALQEFIESKERREAAWDAVDLRTAAELFLRVNDYVDAARAKGLPERLVLKKHARRNALIPTVTVIGLTFGFLLQGTVSVEIIFRWPGIGKWMADSVLRGDQATLMTYVLFTSIVFLVLNLIVDVIYANLDRRVELGK